MPGIEIQLTDDTDHVFPVADVFIDETFVALVTHEDAAAPPAVTFFDDEGRQLATFALDRLIDALHEARDRLAALRQK